MGKNIVLFLIVLLFGSSAFAQQPVIPNNEEARGDYFWAVLYADGEKLLVDEDLADQVWELWDVGLIPDEMAAIAWSVLASRASALPPEAAIRVISG